MKYSMIAAALAVPALTAPLEKRQNIDATVLQFALTLEHLENAFYKGALARFSAADFQAAGFGPNYYANIKTIAADEQSHVDFLSSALTAAGQKPYQPCTYNFPYNSVGTFITLSSVLEGVGTSAYLGAAGLITNKDYLTAAGSILVTEALHTSLQRGAVNSLPFANPYGTPLSPSPVYTLAASFITGCPAGQTFPFANFAGLTLKTAGSTCELPDCKGSGLALKQGASVTLTTATDPAGDLYLTFVSGLVVVSVKATRNGRDLTANIPTNVSGQTYVLATKADAGGKIVDSNVYYGPAIVEVAPTPA